MKLTKNDLGKRVQLNNGAVATVRPLDRVIALRSGYKPALFWLPEVDLYYTEDGESIYHIGQTDKFNIREFIPKNIISIFTKVFKQSNR